MMVNCIKEIQNAYVYVYCFVYVEIGRQPNISRTI